MALVLVSCGGGGGGSSVPTTPAAAVPGVPMAVSAVAGSNTVTLGWGPVASATKYNIYRSTTAGTEMKISSSNTTSYSDTGLANGSLYYYVVTAANSKGEGGKSSEVSATPSAPTGSVTISGTVLYQDKEYDVNGFTGNMPYKAVRYASVDLVVDDTASSVLATAQTDSNGAYSILTTPTTSVVYVRVKTEATLSGITPQVAVKSQSGTIYSAAGNNFIPSGSASVNIAIPATSIGGAFNILDVFTNGIQFVYSLSGTYPPVALSGFWQKSSSNGTYYCSSGCLAGEGIYILNYSGDTDEYDDDVLYHEFGHFIAAHFSQDDSPGGVHHLTDNDLDMRLAWSEGWGDSMPGNIKMWLYTTSPELISSTGTYPDYLTSYIDTYGNSAQIAIDMDNPDGTYNYYNTFIYSCNEVAIAKIILDLNKNFGMQDVWSVLTNFQTTHPNPVNLELFWDQWISLGEPLSSLITTATISSVFSNRQIFYSSDNFEPDDPISSASTYTVNVTGLQQHTLYGAADVDYIAFNAQAGSHYTITTLNLKNGADTFISLINPDQVTPTPVSSPVTNPNDNASGITYISCALHPLDTNCNYDYYDASQNYIYPLNDATTLSSRITFVAPTPGTYYVSVASSPSRPMSAGRYGSYDFTITQP